MTKTANALVRIDRASVPARRRDRTRYYMEAAHADSTRKAYGKAWAAFEAWCKAHGHADMPADPERVADWIEDLAADGAGTGRPLASSTINLRLAAIVKAHATMNHKLDRKHPRIATAWQGISRTKAQEQGGPRQAEALMAKDLRKMIDRMEPITRKIDMRDAALLTLGWAAALRRSELVGLDWMEKAAGGGSLRIEEQGLVVRLATSKGAQAEGVTIAVPKDDAPTACELLQRWVDMAVLEPGQPVFRAIDRHGKSRPRWERLTDRSVARIVKARMTAYYRGLGKSKDDAAKAAAKFSGHSLRAGYATTAGAQNLPGYRIQQHMRHKRMDTTVRYIRAGKQWTESGLQGVGF